MVDLPPPPSSGSGNDNIASALYNTQSATSNNNGGENNNAENSNANSNSGGGWLNKMKLPTPPSSGGVGIGGGGGGGAALLDFSTSAVSTFTKSLTNSIAGRNTLPDKTTASQVLMFRQLLHTSCRPGLRLSRGYEGTPAQKAVLHMPWWERGIERSGKMIISYDNLITRLWISGAIEPFDIDHDQEDDENEGKEEGVEIKAEDLLGGQDENDTNKKQQQQEEAPPRRKGVDTLVNERGLPPIPHTWWIDRLGFQQDDPVTDFRSGGVLSLAMLVHIVESCPDVHARFVPKQQSINTQHLQHSESISNENKELLTSLEEIIHDDASVLPFGITCINITDMLAKFLLFSKSIDKMDALLSAKPFWKMFLDPNAMLVLQEVSLDLLCDVCVEIGRERRLRNLLEDDSLVKDKMNKNAVGMHDRLGKVTVFDFTEIMERTEKRVGEEVLGAGPRNVHELRAVARRVKSKYLMRIQLKEKHLEKRNESSNSNEKQNPIKMIGDVTNESMRNMVGGVGGFVNRFRGSSRTSSTMEEGSTSNKVDNNETSTDDDAGSGSFVVTPSTPTEEVNFCGNDATTSNNDDDPFGLSSSPCCLIDLPGSEEDSSNVVQQEQETTPAPTTTAATAAADDTDAITDLSGALSEAFDLLGDGDFTADDLDSMEVKVDPATAFTIDDL